MLNRTRIRIAQQDLEKRVLAAYRQHHRRGGSEVQAQEGATEPGVHGEGLRHPWGAVEGRPHQIQGTAWLLLHSLEVLLLLLCSCTGRVVVVRSFSPCPACARVRCDQFINLCPVFKLSVTVNVIVNINVSLIVSVYSYTSPQMLPFPCPCSFPLYGIQNRAHPYPFIPVPHPCP